jgi:SAM-dependent methyltransferase
VVGFDFSPAAVAEARALARADGVAAAFAERDIFTLGRDYERAFDGVWEYTCFCAIDPRRRAEYVRSMGAILKPGGWLLACFFPMRHRAAGPPFAVSEPEVRRLFAARFRLERAYRPRSVRPRQGQEWTVLFRKTNAPA